MSRPDPLAGWTSAVEAAAAVVEAWCLHAGPDTVEALEARIDAEERESLEAWPRHAAAQALAALLLAEFSSRDGAA